MANTSLCAGIRTCLLSADTSRESLLDSCLESLSESCFDSWIDSCFDSLLDSSFDSLSDLSCGVCHERLVDFGKYLVIFKCRMTNVRYLEYQRKTKTVRYAIFVLFVFLIVNYLFFVTHR